MIIDYRFKLMEVTKHVHAYHKKDQLRAGLFCVSG